MVLPLISSSPSSSSRSTRMRNLKNSISTLGVNRFTSSLPDIVYHRSDCSYPNSRAYGNGGDSSDTSCINWINHYVKIFPNCNQGLSTQDIIWFGVLNDPVATSKNKIAGRENDGRRNWSLGNFNDMKTIAETTNNGVNKYICSDAGIDLNPNYKE